MDNMEMRKLKWFWPWQDEAQETWLREMSNEGMHLFGIGMPAFFYFESGEPIDYVYRLDFRSHWKMDKEDYLQLFRDSGWEYVEEMAGWHYFRKQAQPGEELEIYTDAESKISKYQRLLTFAAILMLPLFMGMINMRGRFPFFIIFTIFLIYVYALIRILIRINQLKRI